LIINAQYGAFYGRWDVFVLWRNNPVHVVDLGSYEFIDFPYFDLGNTQIRK